MGIIEYLVTSLEGASSYRFLFSLEIKARKVMRMRRYETVVEWVGNMRKMEIVLLKKR